MKLLKLKPKSYSFLEDLINSKVIDYTKIITHSPSSVIVLNMSDTVQTALMSFNAKAQLRSMKFEQMSQLENLKDRSIDLLIANLSDNRALHFDKLLEHVDRLLSQHGIFIFATYNWASKIYLEIYAKQLKTHNLYDIEIAAQLHRSHLFNFFSIKEHVFLLNQANQFIDCNIFFVAPENTINEIAYLMEEKIDLSQCEIMSKQDYQALIENIQIPSEENNHEEILLESNEDRLTDESNKGLELMDEKVSPMDPDSFETNQDELEKTSAKDHIHNEEKFEVDTEYQNENSEIKTALESIQHFESENLVSPGCDVEINVNENNVIDIAVEDATKTNVDLWMATNDPEASNDSVFGIDKAITESNFEKNGDTSLENEETSTEQSEMEVSEQDETSELEEPTLAKAEITPVDQIPIEAQSADESVTQFNVDTSTAMEQEKEIPDEEQGGDAEQGGDIETGQSEERDEDSEERRFKP
ncbi:MAG: hypothetical protein H0W64_10215 [Gammaproteobacteria bacterium]|nr:hypothetical protein [Gammaproteobacteria bacterium]